MSAPTSVPGVSEARPVRGSLGRSVALARFAVESNAGRWLTRGGVLAGIAVMSLGPFLSVRQGGGWEFDREIGFMGFFIMALFATRSGLEEQRALGLVTFVRHNLASRFEHALGLVLGLGGAWLGLCALTFVVVLGMSAGDLELAAWATTAWGLRLLVILGFVPLVEAAASLRLPLLLPVIGYAGLLIALTLVLPEDRAIALFIPVEPGEIDPLISLGVQGAISFGATSTLFLVLMVVGSGVRDRVGRIVPTRP